jgi:hypothetical protein
MFVYENQVNCIEVDDVNKAVRDYEGSGCKLRDRGQGGCVTMDCGEGGLYICEHEDEITGG